MRTEPIAGRVEKRRPLALIPKPWLQLLVWIVAGTLMFLGSAAIGALGLGDNLQSMSLSDIEFRKLTHVYARSVLTAPVSIFLALFILSLALFGGIRKFLAELDHQAKPVLFGTVRRRIGFLLVAALVLVVLWGHVVFALTVMFWLVN